MDYKIIFSDIDGTLLSSERKLSPLTISVVKKLAPMPFILISSRMPKQMTYLQKELGIENQPIIAYNGALVKDGENMLQSTEMDFDILSDIIQFNQKSPKPVHISLYNNDEWYAPSWDFWAKREENNTRTSPEILDAISVLSRWKSEHKSAHKIMLMGEKQNIYFIFKFLSTHFGNDLHIYRGKDTYVEVSHHKVSKLTGVELVLKEKFSFSTAQAIAFGDNYNDLEMIQGVGHGVAMGNAIEPVKEVAKGIALPNTQDGLAHYLSDFLRIS